MDSLEKNIGYTFKNKKILEKALIHTSYANEKLGGSMESNERLEFLGDAVVQISVSEYIYNKYPELPEGDLSKLRANVVCELSLSKVARIISLGKFLKLGKGEDLSGGADRDSILADAFEAVIGAVFVDSSSEVCKKIVLTLLEPLIIKTNTNSLDNDHKSALQEKIQVTSNELPLYTIISETGPDHDKNFISQVSHLDVILGDGEGKTKKEAEQNAAFNAMKKYK